MKRFKLGRNPDSPTYNVTEPTILVQVQNAYNYTHMAYRSLASVSAHGLTVEGLFNAVSLVHSMMQKAQKELSMFPQNAFPMNAYRIPSFVPALPKHIIIDFNIVEADLLVSMYTIAIPEAETGPSRKSIDAMYPPSPPEKERKGKVAAAAAAAVAVVGSVSGAVSNAAKNVVAGVGQGVGMVIRRGKGANAGSGSGLSHAERNLLGYKFTMDGEKCEISGAFNARCAMPMVKSALASLEKAILLCSSLRSKTMVLALGPAK